MKSLSEVTVQRITGNIGAVIGGVDLREALSPEVAAILRQALFAHGVILLRDQDVTTEQYWAFLENFGRPQIDENIGTEHDRAEDVQSGDYRHTRYITAIWHADTTSLAKPPIATALRALQVPPFGGDTSWSSMYAAWDALSEPMKRMLSELTAVHSVEPTIERTPMLAALRSELRHPECQGADPSGGDHASGQRTEGAVRQRALHDAPCRTGPTRERGTARLAIPSCRAAGLYDAVEMVPERHRAVGQPCGPALRGAGL